MVIARHPSIMMQKLARYVYKKTVSVVNKKLKVTGIRANDLPAQLYWEIWDMRKTLALLAVTVMILSSTAYAEVEREYYESGQLKDETHYKDGKLDGIAKGYYESGQLKTEVHFKDGETDGIFKMYYEGGGLMAELNYKDGKQDGISKGYYESGGIEDIVTYKNGQKTNQKHYDRKGKLEFEQDYPTE